MLLKELWSTANEVTVFEKALAIDAFDEDKWWKYTELIETFLFFAWEEQLCFESISIFSPLFFHNTKLKQQFADFTNILFIASVKFDENHLIIIDSIDWENILYTSVGTQKHTPQHNYTMPLNKFFEVYNKRGIILKVKHKKRAWFSSNSLL